MQSGNKNFQIFFVLGAPGSGKGTQAKLLAEKFGFFHFISSQVGKEYIRDHDDEETLRQKERADAGFLFEPEWMSKVVKEKTLGILDSRDKYRGIIYDGSPRTLYEAKQLYGFLVKKVGGENLKLIEIDVPEKELADRIKNRLILEKRVDDKKEIFEIRMKEYKAETLPALEFLKDNIGIIKINGGQSVEKVHGEIMGKLEL